MAKGNIVLDIGTRFNGEGLKKLDQGIQKSAMQVKNASKGIGGVISALGGVEGKVGKIFNGISGLMGSFAAGGAVGVAITGVGMAFKFVTDKINEAKERAKQVAEGIQKAFQERLSNIDVGIKANVEQTGKKEADMKFWAGIEDTQIKTKYGMQINEIRAQGIDRRSQMDNEEQKKLDKAREDYAVTQLQTQAIKEQNELKTKGIEETIRLKEEELAESKRIIQDELKAQKEAYDKRIEQEKQKIAKTKVWVQYNGQYGAAGYMRDRTQEEIDTAIASSEAIKRLKQKQAGLDNLAAAKMNPLEENFQKDYTKLNAQLQQARLQTGLQNSEADLKLKQSQQSLDDVSVGYYNKIGERQNKIIRDLIKTPEDRKKYNEGGIKAITNDQTLIREYQGIVTQRNRTVEEILKAVQHMEAGI